MKANKNVPFFNYQYFHQVHGKALSEIIEDVVARGAFIMQKDLLDFEQHFADYLGVKYAVGVANCTDGLILALRAAGVRDGDEVILPAHTFVATASAVHFIGAKPVLVECGKDHLIDPKSIEAAITKKTKAIMPVQLNGRTCNMDAIQQIAKDYDLLIIEDAAQALGSTFKGKKAGSFGLAAAFSFYPAKILGCFGDGGMVVTNDAKVVEQLKLFRDHGRNDDGEVVCWGGNSRLDNLHAAVLNYFLLRFDEVIKKRRNLAALYDQELSSLKELLLPPAPEVEAEHFDVYQNYEIEAEQRDKLQIFLKEKGVGTLRQWGGKAIHQFKALDFNVILPITERMMNRELMLPMNMSLSEDDVLYVCKSIREFYGY